MRNTCLLTACGIMLAFTASAHAQPAKRALHIDVQPRSWLDAGTSVPVGSMSNYIYDLQGHGTAGLGDPRGWAARPLPDRFSGGRPFTIDFTAPAAR
jgi:hypothetical protein